MSKYILTIVQDQVGNDGLSKPKTDINYILHENEYSIIRIGKLNGKISKLKNSAHLVRKVLKNMTSEDTLLVHYPTYMGALFDNLLLSKANKLHIKIIAFIHDIDSLRFKMPIGKGLRYEVSLLNKYTYAVTPNASMNEFLKKNGLKVKTENLELFDYLTGNSKTKKPTFSHEVIFAGNLNKAKFITHFKNGAKIKYRLYGPLDDTEILENGIYYGSLPSDDLLKELNTGFGLIWDGPNVVINEKQGVSFGNYLRYNNPYKLSLYIAAGLPIIIWKYAAEAQFVQEHNLGYVIKDLHDLPEMIEKITGSEYSSLVDNVDVMRKKVLQGEFTKNAIDKIDKLMDVQNTNR